MTAREAVTSAGHSWNISLLTPAEPGRRNRRTIDGVLVAATAVLAGLAAVVARSAPDVDEEVVLHPPIQRFLTRWRPGDPVVYLGPIWAP